MENIIRKIRTYYSVSGSSAGTIDTTFGEAYIPGRNTSYHHISYEVIEYKDIIGCTGSYLGAKKNRSKGKWSFNSFRNCFSAC